MNLLAFNMHHLVLVRFQVAQRRILFDFARSLRWEELLNDLIPIAIPHVIESSLEGLNLCPVANVTNVVILTLKAGGRPVSTAASQKYMI
jgi:hypothetical protein